MLQQSAYLWGTSFDKHTTYQGIGMKVRKIIKENKDTSENNKTETGQYWEGVPVNTESSPVFNFPYTVPPQYNRGKKAEDCFNMIQRTTGIVTSILETQSNS